MLSPCFPDRPPWTSSVVGGGEHVPHGEVMEYMIGWRFSELADCGDSGFGRVVLVDHMSGEYFMQGCR